MAVRWDWEDERPIDKWYDVGLSNYEKCRTIALCTSHTFGSLLYEREGPAGYGYTYLAQASGDVMKKILGNSGTVEIFPGAGFEVYLNSFGQNAIDRKYIFQRVVSDMKAKGYNDVAFNLDESHGTLWFSVKPYPKAAFEQALRAFNECLSRNFNV